GYPQALHSFPTRRSSDLKTIQDFLFGKKKELGFALQWLLFRGWLPEADRPSWSIPRCPATPDCPGGEVSFTFSSPVEVECLHCGDRKSTRLNSSHVKISY